MLTERSAETIDTTAPDTDGTPLGALQSATRLVRVGEGVYSAELPEDWAYHGHPNGGFLIALAGQTALAATGRVHPFAVTASYVRAARSGPARLHAEPVKSGRSLDNVRVTVRQEERVVLDVLAAVGDRPRESEPEWALRKEPVPAPYADCVPMPAREGRPGILHQVEVRYDPEAGAVPHGGAPGPARVRGWVSFRDGSEPDVLTPLLAADILAPTVFNLGLGGWAPTVQLSCYVRAVPAPGPLAVSVCARQVGGGWFDEEADVYDSTGRLVAQSRQLALIGNAG
jgi:acyl-coenzyme A thioesterase PaaI-like protein